MGKVVKYCSLCEESFNDKFSFCPNCAAVLNSHEINLNVSGDESFQVTFVEQKGSNSRQALMLGAALFVMGGGVFSLVGSIYNADAYVNGLEDSLVYIASINNDEPSDFVEPDIPKDKLQGGGGKGGNKNLNPVSKGVLASQSENPLVLPSVTMDRVTDPAIKIKMETKGVIKRKPTDQPYGDQNSKYDVLSDGNGENGGQGIGRDRGQGIGDGPGGGPGSGIGVGPGPGGPGITSKNNTKSEIENEPPRIKEPVGETTAMKILSKPRAIYTDDARKNQRAGTVTLRVTFMANGSIGNIAVVSGLPDGLTENAIAAAKNIQFEPAKRNGRVSEILCK